MSRNDYGGISVISDEEREALGLGGPRPDDEEEGLFETLGKTIKAVNKVKRRISINLTLILVMVICFFSL